LVSISPLVKFTISLNTLSIKTITVSAILLFAVHFANTQSLPPYLGAGAMGTGYSSACRSDEWALFNNVGGLAKVEHVIAAFTYHAQPGFTAFDRMGAAFTFPFRFGVVSSGVYRFGDDLYNEQTVSAGFANSFGLASLGLKVSYTQYHTETSGNSHAITVSAGGIAAITSAFSVGAHVININQPELSAASAETVPTLLILGIALKPSDKVQLTAEVEKDLDYPITWKSGISWQLHKKIVARTGFNINPQAGFGGLGFRTKNFLLDYAYQYNVTVGSSHQASIAYQIKTK
jgi:hypothetical protein